MKYFFAAEERLLPLAKFTATLPQEEHTFQTFIDRTDEIPTGRIIPGNFSWSYSEGEPKVTAGQKFCIITEDVRTLTCQVVDLNTVCTGTVLECQELDAESREKMKSLIDAANQSRE